MKHRGVGRARLLLAENEFICAMNTRRTTVKCLFKKQKNSKLLKAKLCMLLLCLSFTAVIAVIYRQGFCYK